MGQIKLASATHLSKKLATSRLAKSASYVVSHSADLAGIGSAGDLAISADKELSPKVPEPTRRILSACVYHLTQLRIAILKELWSRSVFIGVGVIDDLLLASVQSGRTDPIKAAFEFIRDKGLHRPGLLIFPLHSFGMLGAGLAAFTVKTRPSLVVKEYGMAISPQTNSLESTFKFISEAARELDVTQQVSRELFDHWSRSRSLEWLRSNPLMILRTQSFPGSYYENQSLLSAKLEFATSFVFLVASFQSKKVPANQRLSSSAAINNFETLDFNHYIVLFRGMKAGTLGGDCVPMMAGGRWRLAELADLSVEVDPSHWTANSAFATRLIKAMQTVERGYFSSRFASDSGAVKTRVMRKIFNSLSYFRRSFRKTMRSDEPLVHLGTAFEVLLTDRYQKGVGARIIRRVKLAVSGNPDEKELFEAVEKLYEDRSKALHEGEAIPQVDLALAQRTYAIVFLSVVERLGRLRGNAANPMGSLLGDTGPTESTPCAHCHGRGVQS